MSIWIRWRRKNKTAIWSISVSVGAILLVLALLVTMGWRVGLFVLAILAAPTLLVLLIRWLRHDRT